MPINEVRQTAKAIYPANLEIVGSHTRLDVSAAGDWIVRPEGANHIQMQALTQNIRYTIDTSQSSATHGFQLSAGSVTLIPCPLGGISVFEESSGAIIQYQWVR